MVLSREYDFYWDVENANPNGDMQNENRPRYDPKTGLFEVSDVRIKRFIRDEWLAQGLAVFVTDRLDANGNIKSCTNTVADMLEQLRQDIPGLKKVKPEEKSDEKPKKKARDIDERTALIKYLKDTFIDVRLFGATITTPKYDIHGDLQVHWSKSINVPEIKVVQGNAGFASGEGMDQTSIWTKFMTPYALFRTYAAFNSATAKREGIDVTDDDLDLFMQGFIRGLINYRSTSKYQMPRLAVEVIYSEHMLDGELKYVDVLYDCADAKLRSISQVTFDLARLGKYYEAKKNVIKEVRIHRHSSAKVINMHKDFKEIPM